MYAAVVRAIQSVGIFFQHVKKNTGYAFAGVKKILWETFFPRLFFVKLKYLPPIVGTLITIPVKKEIMGLQNPVNSADERFQSSQHVSTEFIRAMNGESYF